ncbi:MAG: diaminopimelate epimerase [Phycisphaerales bacterium]
MRLVKMHGLGNDYLYLDAVSAPLLARHPDLPGLARRVSDRHTGVGSDGLIMIGEPTGPGAARGARVRMRMFNADGTESGMCGNGIRCVAKFAVDRLGMSAQPLAVETGRGVLNIEWARKAGGGVTGATVDMGEPILEPARIPIDLSKLEPGKGAQRYVLPEARQLPEFVAVSMGNPHIVIFDPRPIRQPETDRFMAGFGPTMERHVAFPERTNVHLVNVSSRTEATMVTWERGSGLTRACGTGACAVLVAGALTDRLDRGATIHLPGGDLQVRWDEWSNHVFMTGPASEICEVEWPDMTPWSPTLRPTILTERLVLRPFLLSDAPRVAELAGAKEIASTTLLIPHPYHEQDAIRWIATHDDEFVCGRGVNFAICARGPGGGGGPVMGAIGLVRSPRHQRAELGYWIGVPFWNQGFTTEAARAVVKYGLETLALRRVDSHHYARNPASGRVLEKAGFVREGMHPRYVHKWEGFEDAVMYGILNPRA